MSSDEVKPLFDHILSRNLKRGGVTTIQSIGEVITSGRLKDRMEFPPPTRAEVIEEIKVCILAQQQQLSDTTDPDERSKIQKTIEQLQSDLVDPNRYLF